MQPKVLFADDDEISRNICGELFARAGWDYDVVPDAVSALDAASRKEYDVILTDLVMPGMDGHALLRALRASNPIQPIIVVTGSQSVEDVIDSLREGAADILQKPLDYHALKGSVERLIASARKSQGEDRQIYQYLASEHSLFEFTARDLATIKFSIGLIDRLSRAGKIDRLTRMKLHLAIQEAIANSLDHGSLELLSAWKDEYDDEGNDKFTQIKKKRLDDPQYGERKIYVKVDFENCRLTISIRDEGKGFGLRDSAPKENDGKPAKPYGRGLAIISGILDEVNYERNGAEIVMVKYIV